MPSNDDLAAGQAALAASDFARAAAIAGRVLAGGESYEARW